MGEIPIEVILVNNQSQKDEIQKIEQHLSQWSFPVRIVNYNGTFNFAHMHNLAVRDYCRGNYLFLLNNDVFLSENDNLDEMVSWAAQPMHSASILKPKR